MDAEPVTPDAFLIFHPEVAPQFFRPFANTGDSFVSFRRRNVPLADTRPSSVTLERAAVSGITSVSPKEPETTGPAMSPRRPVLHRPPEGVLHIPVHQFRIPGRREPDTERDGRPCENLPKPVLAGNTPRERSASPERPSPLRRYLPHRAARPATCPPKRVDATRAPRLHSADPTRFPASGTRTLQQTSTEGSGPERPCPSAGFPVSRTWPRGPVPDPAFRLRRSPTPPRGQSGSARPFAERRPEPGETHASTPIRASICSTAITPRGNVQ